MVSFKLEFLLVIIVRKGERAAHTKEACVLIPRNMKGEVYLAPRDIKSKLWQASTA